MSALQFISNVIDIAYAVMFFRVFCETLTIRRSKLLRLTALLLAAFICPMPVYSYSILNLMLGLSGLAVFTAVFFSDSWRKKMLMILFFYPVMIAVNYLVYNVSERVSYALTGADPVGDWSARTVLIFRVIYIIFAVIRLLFGILAYVFLRKYLQQIPEKMTDRIWTVITVLLMVPNLSVFIILCFLPENSIFIYLICISAVFSGVGSIYLAAYICRSIETNEHAEILEMRQSYYEERLKDEERVRRIYHDMKNHLLLLQSRIAESGEEAKEEKQRETEKMICSLRKQIEDYEDYIQTGNPFLDIIMRDKARAAKEKEIDLKAEIDFSQGGFIDGLDISTIFGNALDNAIEACERVQRENRFITVRAAVKNAFLVIVLENSAAPGAESRERDKKDPFLHGFGLKNIRRAAEKYGGSCRLEWGEESCSLSVILPIPERT